MALLGGVLPLRIMSRREPRNHALDRALSCSAAMGYYGMDRSGQYGISAAEALACHRMSCMSIGSKCLNIGHRERAELGKFGIPNHCGHLAPLLAQIRSKRNRIMLTLK